MAVQVALLASECGGTSRGKHLQEFDVAVGLLAPHVEDQRAVGWQVGRFRRVSRSDATSAARRCLGDVRHSHERIASGSVAPSSDVFVLLDPSRDVQLELVLGDLQVTIMTGLVLKSYSRILDKQA